MCCGHAQIQEVLSDGVQLLQLFFFFLVDERREDKIGPSVKRH